MAAALAGALVVSALVGFVGVASGAPARAPASANVLSTANIAAAFGNVTTLPVGTVGGPLSGSAVYGFASEIGQSAAVTNGSEIFVQQVDALSVSLEICHPNCAAPLTRTNLTYRAFQAYDSWTNTTPGAQVEASFQNGTVAFVSAIGILNSHVRASGGVEEAFTTTENATTIAHLNASAAYSADSEVAFSPALGVLPRQPQGVVAWRSDANYTASGTWSATWSINASGPIGGALPVPTLSTGAHTVTDAGPLSLRGVGAGEGPFHDRTSYRLEPRFVGAPLALVGGLAVTLALPNPFAGDLGSGWESENHVLGTIAPAQVVADPTSGELVVSTVVTFGGGVTDPSRPGSNQSLPSSSVAGAPMTGSQYSAYASCLQSSPASCPAVASPGAPSGPANTPGVTAALAIGAVVIAAAVVTALVVGQKRRLPSAQYPQAALYPPGTPAARGRTATRPAEAEAPRAEDPLDRLW